MTDFAKHIITWQKQYGRHDLPWQNTRDPYAIWVSEIMLQQTQVVAVIGYYQLFMARFPTILSLASAEQEEVLQYWSGLGYYSRARNLHQAAQTIID
ncbi:MAG TPA: A/G-specific adenine glycosylase, partial [Methylophilaceae bacterium]|nr:A/G-specific adenine glycosylase [Methylophilaceae bacterium]